jgi:hypothetical protein
MSKQIRRSPVPTLTVGEAARRLDVHPTKISQVLAAVDPHHKVIPVKGHRRRIPENLLANLKCELEVRGILTPPAPFV